MTSVPAVAEGRPTVHIRGTAYPVLLPTIRDPRLHLAGVIVTLQVLGQTTFDFDLSIAQILVSLLTCAVLEVTIAFRRQRVLMWPASALLTGNGVAFVLRVPGTEHGDWWSMHGWWIFAGTAAIALLSKYLIVFRGRHVFNPSNFGLVLCFLLIGPERADPLAFWWGPMSVWLALALVLIVGGGLAILRRLRLVAIAVGFWLTFAAGIAVLAATGHEMTAAWHLGPIGGLDLWWLLVTSPEILVFLFFMITDPRTIPASDAGRRVYAVSVGFLAALLMAPWTTEFAHKVALLGALALVCALRPLLLLVAEGRAERARELGARDVHRRPRRRCGARRDRGRGAPRARRPADPSGGRARGPGRHRSRADGHRRLLARARARRPEDRAADRRRPRDRPRGRGRGTAHTQPRAGERARRPEAGSPTSGARIDASRGGRGRGDDLRRGPHPTPARARRGAGPTARRGDAPRHDPNGDVRRFRAPSSSTQGEPVEIQRTFEMVEHGGRYLVAAVRGAPGAAAPAPSVRALVHADGRRRDRRARLPSWRVPLHPSRSVPRRDRDDGRRRLLARLRRATAGSTCTS